MLVHGYSLGDLPLSQRDVWAHWLLSEEDYADSLEEEILDDGGVPRVALQEMADAVEHWKARHAENGCAPTLTKRP